MTTPKPFKQAREDFERDYLTMVLRAAGGNVSKAANLAGKYRADFCGLLRKYGLKPGPLKKE